MKPRRFQVPRYSMVIALTVVMSLLVTPCAIGQQLTPGLPKAKQTDPGLYLTAKEAYEKWRLDPENITVLDVRTTEEYLFVGHAPMAWTVPLMSQTYAWDAEKQQFAMQPNPEFVAQVTGVARLSGTIFVMCRSGSRSAMAVNLLAQAGFKHVYNITDGMEGDEVKDPESLFEGQRLRNGWKNSGIPWTYQPDPERMRFAPPQPGKQITGLQGET